jgi:hypothetical protein
MSIISGYFEMAIGTCKISNILIKEIDIQNDPKQDGFSKNKLKNKKCTEYKTKININTTNKTVVTNNSKITICFSI